MKKIVISLFFLLTSNLLFSATQSMIIPTGSIQLNSSQTQINAYCCDKGRDTPAFGYEFRHAKGKIKLVYEDGASRILENDDVLDYIKGNGAFISLDIVQSEDLKIKTIEVIDSIILLGEDNDNFENYFNRKETLVSKEIKLKEIDLNNKIQINQHVNLCNYLWSKDFKRYQEKGNKIIEYLNTENPMMVKKPKLANHGNFNIVVTPSKEVILYDTGTSIKDYELIQKELNNIKEQLGKNEIELYIIASHAHKDHIGNLSKILEDDHILIKNLLLPKNISESKKEIIKIKSLLTQKNYSKYFENDFFELYSLKKNDKLEIIDNSKKLDWISNNNNLFGFTEEISSLKSLNSLTIRTKKGSEMDILHINKNEINDINDRSIMLRVRNNNFSYLFTGDITNKILDHFSDTQILFTKQKEMYSKFENNEELSSKYNKYQKKVSDKVDKLNTNILYLLKLFVYSKFLDNEGMTRLVIKEHYKIIKKIEGFQEFKYLDNYLTDYIYSYSLRSSFIDWFHHAEFVSNVDNIHSYDRIIDIINPTDISINANKEISKGQQVKKLNNFLLNRMTNYGAEIQQHSILNYKQVEFHF